MTLVAPTPRFAIGDTIWTANIQSTSAQLDCPDCLGSRIWKVTTPAGTEMDTVCLRCASGYRGSDDLPSLTYQAWAPMIRSLTISGIEMTGHPSSDTWGRDQVRYQCFPTPGGGTVVDESRAFVSEAEALVEAQRQAAEKNIETAAKPEVTKAKRVGELTIVDARFDQFKNGLWDAFYAARRLGSNIRDTIEEPGESVSELVEAIEEHMKWEAGPHTTPTPIEALVRAVEADIEAGDATDRTITAMAGIPAPMKAALIEDKVWARMTAARPIANGYAAALRGEVSPRVVS